MLTVLQALTLPEGGFAAGVGIGLGAAAAGISWAVRQLKAPSANGNGHDSEKTVEFRATTNATLSRLTGVIERQAETQALVVRNLERLGEHVESHDHRTAKAISIVEDTHRLAVELHRKLG